MISADMILKRKHVRSQVAATLRSPFRQKGPTSRRTAIRNVRVLKMVVDVRFTRRADALPLACCVFMRLIRCPDNLWRVRPARGRMRKLIQEVDPAVVEEWKWMGSPVWSHDGNICTGESYRKSSN